MKTIVIFVLCACSAIVFAPSANAETNRLPIIDMHVHIYDVETFGGDWPKTICTSKSNLEFPGVDAIKEITAQSASVCDEPMSPSATSDLLMEETVAAFDEYNIIAVTAGGGDLEKLEKWQAASPNRIIPAIRFHRHEYSLERLRQLYREGQFRVFHEIGPQYDGKTVDAPEFDPYFALAEELDIPVGIHLGLGPPGGPNLAGMSSFRNSAGNPQRLEPVLTKYPHLRVWVQHMAYPHLEDLIALLYSYPQVYVDISGVNWLIPRPEFYRQLKVLVDAGFSKRLMFGSDQMIWPKTIGIAIQIVEEAEFLTESQKRDIFYNNAARFLRLSDNQIAEHHDH